MLWARESRREVGREGGGGRREDRWIHTVIVVVGIKDGERGREEIGE